MKNTLETRLGIFFALALVVAVLILEMIGAADFFKGGYHMTASFKTAQDLKKGDLVKMAGVEIGRVQDVELENGRAKVTMKIQAKHQIKTDAKAAIKFTGLMGQNFSCPSSKASPAGSKASPKASARRASAPSSGPSPTSSNRTAPPSPP